MSDDAPAKTRALALARNPLLVYEKRVLIVRGPSGLFRLDTDRFGRKFVSFGRTVYATRITRGHTQDDIARALGIDKALLSSLENASHGKLRLSFMLVGNLTHLLDLEQPASESYLAYVSEVYSDARALNYPDDPGELGPRFGLPLAGAAERMAAREKRP